MRYKFSARITLCQTVLSFPTVAPQARHGVRARAGESQVFGLLLQSNGSTLPWQEAGLDHKISTWYVSRMKNLKTDTGKLVPLGR